MAFAELELALLRHWAVTYAWLEAKKSIESHVRRCDCGMRSTTRAFLLHRIRWFNTIEDLGGLHVIGTERHEAGASTTSSAAARPPGRQGLAASSSRSRTT
jgi:preprotein translocase subunit SecA